MAAGANGGLARGEGRRSNVGKRIVRKEHRSSSARPSFNGRASAKAQGGVRASSGGRFGVKASGRSRGRGCNGHWILRRVLTDGRHPRSSRTFARHGAEVTVVSAAPSFPALPAKASGSTGGRRRGDRDVSGSIAEGARGTTTPTLGTPGGEKSPSDVTVLIGLAPFSVRQSGLGRRETPGPPVKPRRA